MQAQLLLLQKVITYSLNVFVWIIPAMIIVDIILEYGVLRRFMSRVGWIFGCMANLPREMAAPFISSFGSSYAAGAMLVSLKEKGLLKDREVFLSALTFSLPFYIRELFSYYLPVIIPLLGLTLGIVYLTVHAMLIAVRIILVIVVGKLTLPPVPEQRPLIYEQDEKSKQSLSSVIDSAFKNSIKPLKRMIITIPLTTLVIFELNAFGLFDIIPVNSQALGLPACGTACIVAYLANPIVGLTSVAACFNGGEMSMVEAVKTILWSGLLANPIALLRYSGSYYLGVYGSKLGGKLTLCTLGLNTLVYLAGLALVSNYA